MIKSEAPSGSAGQSVGPAAADSFKDKFEKLATPPSLKTFLVSLVWNSWTLSNLTTEAPNFDRLKDSREILRAN